MSHITDFERQWRARFPSDEPPNLACFGSDGQDTNLQVAEEVYRKCKERAKQLQKEADQQNFLAHFLGELINNPKPPNYHSLTRSKSPGQAPGETHNADPDLDSPIPFEDDRRSRRSSSRKSAKLKPSLAVAPQYLETNLDFEVGIPPADPVDKHRVENNYLSEPQRGLDPLTINNVPRSSHAPWELGPTVSQSSNSGPLPANESKHDNCQDAGPLSSLNVIKRQSSEGSNTSGDSVANETPPYVVANLNVHDDSVQKAGKSISTTRKLSEKSNSAWLSTKQKRDQFEKQPKALSSSQESHGQNGLSSQTSPSFSTFRPQPQAVKAPEASNGDDASRPIPAPRPSVKGPSFKSSSKSRSVDIPSPGVEKVNPGFLNRKGSMPNESSNMMQHRQQGDPEPREPSFSGIMPIGSTSNIGQGDSSLRNSKRDRPQTAAKPLRNQNAHNYMNVDMDQIRQNLSLKDKGRGPSGNTPSMIQSGPPPLMVRKTASKSPSHSPKLLERSISAEAKSDSGLNANTTSNPRDRPVSSMDPPVPLTRSPGLRGSGRSKNRRADREEPIYEEPIAVNRQQLEEDESSSDDEPVYYNLMLMKKKSLGQVSQSLKAAGTLYGSVDLQKQQLEKQAQRLSRRYSASLDVPTARSMGNALTAIQESGKDGSTATMDSDIVDHLDVMPVNRGIFQSYISMILHCIN